MTREEKLESVRGWLKRHNWAQITPNMIAMITIDLLGWNMTSEEIVYISDNLDDCHAN